MKSLKNSPFTLVNVLLFAFLIFVNSCNNQQPQGEDLRTYGVDNEYIVAAYIWPSCHHDERMGEVMWPQGEGEWEIIKKGNPRFEGHYQPRLPLWGYEADNDPKVMEKWINAAVDHGVNTFIFDWYWYDEGPWLESTLNDGFLKAPNNKEMDFYLMWANHDVRRNYWNVHKYKDDASVIWNGFVDMKNFEIIVGRVISKYFNQSNYLKINGSPVFSIFRMDNLIKSFGSMEATVEAMEYFREKTKEAGFPDLHLQMIVTGNPRQPLIDEMKTIGVNSVTWYNWGGPHPEDYLEWGSIAMERWQKWDEAMDIPHFPNASIGWDDTPRWPHKTKEHVVHYNKSPESFSGFLYKAKEYCDNHPDQPPIITIFSWNEWVEGGYLLPDVKYGFQYLEAVDKVLSGKYNPYQSK